MPMLIKPANGCGVESVARMAKKREKTETEAALEEIRGWLTKIQKDRDEIFVLIHRYQLDTTIAIDKINDLLQKLRYGEDK